MVELIDRYLYEAESNFDTTMLKVDAVTEAAGRQFNINFASAQLKVMQESGTDDDLAYYYEEAKEGFLATCITILKKIKDAIIKFFSEVKDKIISLFSKSENKDAVDKIEKKIKIFPLFGKKKVMVEDIEGQNKVADEHMSMLAKLKAKVASGQNVSVEDVDEVEKSFMEKHGKKVGVGAAILVTAVGAIALYKAHTKGLTQKVNEEQKKANAAIDELENIASKNKEALGESGAKVLTKIGSVFSTISKTKVAGMVKHPTSILHSLKEAFGRTPVAKGVMKIAAGKGKKAVKESTDDDTSEEFEKIMKSAQDSDDATTEYSDEDPFDDAMMNAADIGDPMKIDVDDLSEESAAFDEIYDHIFGSSVTEDSDDEGDDYYGGSEGNTDGLTTFESLMAEIESLGEESSSLTEDSDDEGENDYDDGDTTYEENTTFESLMADIENLL